VPTFGKTPPVIAGRYEFLNDFRLSLQDGPGAPGRATLVTGTRGVGKTVLLNEFEDIARSMGWLVITETATEGFINRIVKQHLPRLNDLIDPPSTSRRVTSASAPLGLGRLSWETPTPREHESGFRTSINDLTDRLAANRTGVLITLDEAHNGPKGELTDICTSMQHFVRENRDVAFAAAGLPRQIEERLLNDPGLTFMRRAERVKLGAIDLDDVKDALRRPIIDNGRDITDQALQAAAELTAGYPYLIQAVGLQAWRQRPDAHTINLEDIDLARPQVMRRLGSMIHDTALKDISDVDRSFLLAMAADNGPSRMADIAERMGVDAVYAGQYRLRLLAAELISAPARGIVEFELPYLGNHLREHFTHHVQGRLTNQPAINPRFKQPMNNGLDIDGANS
jgi:hypothetical protein